MSEKIEELPGADVEQIKIVVNSLYLCLGYALNHMVKTEGASAAAQFKEELLTALKNGDIDMAIFEDRKTFDLVVSRIESLGAVKA